MNAPRGSVELEEAEELERLRRRAYGPDANIAGDAAACSRLSALEAAAQYRRLRSVVEVVAGVPDPFLERVPVSHPVEGSRSASTSVLQAVGGALPEHEPAGESVLEDDPAEGLIADSDPIRRAPAAPWWRRRRWVVAILVGAIAALALNAALVASMSQLLAERSTPSPTETTAQMPRVPAGFGSGPYLPAPDFVLALESVALQPNDPHRVLDALGISPDELRRYEDFRGLNVWSGESRYGMTCLLVAVPGQGPREGTSAEGCSPQGLEPIAELVHPGNDGFSTGAVFTGLPTGGLIRFVLKGDDHVDVYLYVMAADPNAPQG